MKISRFQNLVLLISLMGIVALAAYLLFQEGNLGVNFLLGITFGYVMKNSDFSFTANLRDIVLFRKFQSSICFFKMALTTCLGIQTIILIQSLRNSFNWEFYLQEPTTVSAAFLIGSIIFGIGIAITGSAGSGFMKKAVSGDKEYIIGVLFYFIGSIFGVFFREAMLKLYPSGKLFMPAMLGWPLAILIQLGLIILILFFLKRLNRKGEKVRA